MATNPLLKKLVTQTAAKPLTESELFQRYLDAPVRVDATTSTLIASAGNVSDITPREAFSWDRSGYFVPSFYEELLEEIESDETPLLALERLADELSDIMEAVKKMQRDFDRLAEATRTEPPDDDAPDEVYRDWEENPRYILPVIEQKAAA